MLPQRSGQRVRVLRIFFHGLPVHRKRWEQGRRRCHAAAGRTAARIPMVSEVDLKPLKLHYDWTRNRGQVITCSTRMRLPSSFALSLRCVGPSSAHEQPAKEPMSTSPDRRKSRKLTPLHLQVSQMLSSTR